MDTTPKNNSKTATITRTITGNRIGSKIVRKLTSHSGKPNNVKKAKKTPGIVERHRARSTSIGNDNHLNNINCRLAINGM